ncbi:MAG: pilus (MSHA type) biogenesis protein MshL [Desulfobulbaceae bacterium]|nr:pilus (MSHA type) biogenesis protein MshL [Desulfobulbaceae bacterium]
MAAQHRHNHGLRKSGIISWICALAIIASFCGCAPHPTPEDQANAFIAEHTKDAIDGSAVKQKDDVSAPQQLPVRYQNPSYSLKSPSGVDSGFNSELSTPVGAKIAPVGPKPLRMVIQELAKLKGMNVSWANDVDKDSLVQVTIMPEEDFFEAIDNVLRQLDYSHEMQGNTIVIKHKETKKFHIAMPFMASSYSTGVGGDVLGNTEGSNMTGNLNLNSSENKFDIWKNIEANLDKILEIWSAPPPPVTVAATAPTTAGAAGTTPPAETAPPAATTPPSENSGHSGLGYYTIDRPIGLVTVTAPPSLLEKVESYINNLKGEIYRQVSIEAKIVEVTLSNDNTSGLDWSALSSQVGLNFNFSSINLSQGSTFTTEQDNSMVTLVPPAFNVLIDAMKKQGSVEVLSNPKLSVMNGQPAMISVGENVTYVKSVDATTDGTTGSVTYTITPDSVMSGLGMGVIATILDDEQIILNLTPVTSSLTQPIEYKVVGGSQVGLPKVNLRELSTMVRVKSGEMLVVGGLTDTRSTYNNDSLVGLGEIPSPVGKLFRKDGTDKTKKELIILLRPQIISL